jgi:hypothetical protein
MIPTHFALLAKEASDPGGLGLVLGLIALAVIAIVGVAKSVLGGDHQTSIGSLSAIDDESNQRTGQAKAEAELEIADPYRDHFHEKATREANAVHRSKPKFSALVQESILGWSGDSHDAADQEFEAVIAETIPVEAQEKAFYVKVVGTSHRNSDRTSRTRIIDECSAFDPILLVPEPDNHFDPNAIAVRRRETNEQLGYLDARLAGEISRDIKRCGPRWIAFFRHKTQHPDTDKTVGAVIRLICLSEEFLAESDVVRAVQIP